MASANIAEVILSIAYHLKSRPCMTFAAGKSSNRWSISCDVDAYGISVQYKAMN